VVIGRPQFELAGWRADQILTGPLFGLASTCGSQNPSGQAKIASLVARRDLSERGPRAELEALAAQLNVRLPNPKETEEARLAFELVEDALNEKAAKDARRKAKERSSKRPNSRCRKILTDFAEENLNRATFCRT
jgi:hypothetical protein